MLKILNIILLIVTITFSMELDPVMLQEIVDKNPQALKEKVLLAKYYIKKDNHLKALTLLDDVLKQDNKNIQALKLKKSIDTINQNKEVIRKAGLSYPIDVEKAKSYLKNIYEDNDYKKYIKVYTALVSSKIKLDTINYINAAYIYLWDGKYDLSARTLEHIEDKHNLEKTKIQADICYYKGEYACALKLLKKLYTLNPNVDDGIKLVYSYFYLGYIDEAKKLYSELFKTNPENKELEKIKGTLSKQESKALLTAKEAYLKNKNIDTLKKYCSILYNSGHKKETLDVLSVYNKKLASTDSLILEATYLSWSAKLKHALRILENLPEKNDLKIKLLIGQIASWDNNAKKAKENLNDVIAKSKDKKQLYAAKKALAYVYKWGKENEKAKKLFMELYNENKEDIEVRDALLELNGDYETLIKIYENNSSQGGGGSANKKQLSELYFKTKQTDKAIESLKAYVQENPKDLEAVKNLALMQIDKKEYYAGFGNLEYYAAKKNDINSSMLLAKNYFWHAFPEEAVEVLDRILVKYPNNKEAMDLRAKILKTSPRYTRSNSGATVNDYFNTVNLKQLKVADALYFAGHHAASLMYYQNYLRDEPDNHNVRLRYAFALENAGRFGKAEGEFFLMLWSNDTDEIKYHYGYNLMMNGKLDKAKEVFLALKKSIFKGITPNLKSFMNAWKKDWESKDYTRYKQNYANNITNDENWALSTQQSFNDVSFISVGLYDMVSKITDKPNNFIVKFYDEVTTNLGTKKGYTTLDVACANHEQECSITKESFVPGEYSKFVSLEPILNQRLKDIKVFRKRPYLLEKIKYQKKKL